MNRYTITSWDHTNPVYSQGGDEATHNYAASRAKTENAIVHVRDNMTELTWPVYPEGTRGTAVFDADDPKINETD